VDESQIKYIGGVKCVVIAWNTEMEQSGI
jgi:hypothetical protein